MSDNKQTYDLNLAYGFQFSAPGIVRSFTSRYLSEKFGHFAPIATSTANAVLSKGFSIKELQGIGDLGFGVNGAKGGVSNSSFIAKIIPGVIANSSKMKSPLTAVGNIGAISNLNFVSSKLSNLGTNLNSLTNVALKNGLGISAIEFESEIKRVSTVFKEAESYYRNLGFDKEANEFLQKINTIESIKNISSDPSMRTAEQLEYVSTILSDTTNVLNQSLGLLSEVGNLIGGLSTVDGVLSTVMSESWNILNNDSGNSLIKAAFSVSNRLMQKDGISGQYSWASSFISSVLSDAGVDSIDAISPAAWTKWGLPVNINDFSSFRINDLLIFTTVSGIMHMGFLKTFDPKTRKATIVGGNQGGGAGALVITLNTPFFSIKGQLPSGLLLRHVKRNWTAPKDAPPTESPSTPAESSGSYLADRQRERDAARGNTPSL